MLKFPVSMSSVAPESGFSLQRQIKRLLSQIKEETVTRFMHTDAKTLGSAAEDFAAMK